MILDRLRLITEGSSPFAKIRFRVKVGGFESHHGHLQNNKDQIVK